MCWLQKKSLLTTSKWILDEVISSGVSKPVHLEVKTASQQDWELLTNKNNLMLCSAAAADCSYLKCVCPLINRCPGRQWWGELFVKNWRSVCFFTCVCGVWCVCEKHTNTQRIMFSQAATLVFYPAHTHSYIQTHSKSPEEQWLALWLWHYHRQVVKIQLCRQNSWPSQHMLISLHKCVQTSGGCLSATCTCLFTSRLNAKTPKQERPRSEFSDRNMLSHTCLFPQQMWAFVVTNVRHELSSHFAFRSSLSLSTVMGPLARRAVRPQSGQRQGAAPEWRKSKENELFALSSQPAVGWMSA